MSGKAISSLLFFSIFTLVMFAFVTKPAYADTTLTYGTLTGGTMDATDDCADIAVGNGVGWVNCNGVLLVAFNPTTFAVYDEEAITNSGTMLATVAGTSVLLFDATANTIKKYSLISNVIYLSGSWSAPTACTGFDLATLEYQFDETGYLWFGCPTSDMIVKMNPTSMTTTLTSQDLTDGAGIDCDITVNSMPMYSQSDAYGFVSCDEATDTLTSWTISGSTITFVDEENIAGAGVGSNTFFLNSHNNRGAVMGTAAFTFTYDGAGALTPVAFPTSNSYESCTWEPYLSTDTYLVCLDDIGTEFQLDAFLSSTTFTQVASVVSANSMPSGRPIAFDIQEQKWYATEFQNSIKVAVLSGLPRTSGEPDAPPEGDTSECVAAAGEVCVDTDGDGIGDLLIPDTDGDGIPDFPPSSFPPVTGGADAADRLANLIRVMSGFDLSTSKLVIAAVIHLLMIGAVAYFSIESKHPLPMIAYAAVIIIAGGISFVAGFMDGLIFMAETIMIVGGFAFMMSRGVR